MTSGTLVAGIGNIFLGDDGFGVEVASRLAQVGVPAGVRVADYGIRGMHLAYDLASGYDAAILIDATPRGEAPGTLYVIEPELGGPPAAQDASQSTSTAANASPATAVPDGPARANPGDAGRPAPAATSAALAGTAPDAATPDDDPDDGDPDDAGLGQALTANPFFDAHGMQPDVVFAMLDTLDGGRPRRILIVGCEPASVDYGIGLSSAVAAVIDEAVRLVQKLLAHDLLATERPASELAAAEPGGPDCPATEGRTHVSRHSR
jgi:hydrogenase maturation protease